MTDKPRRMVHQELASELDETCAEPTLRAEDQSLRETEDFEENLAEAVYEGLSWVSSVVASTLDLYVQGASNVEIGLRKARLGINDCENLEKGLEKTFGFGARMVEYKILRILHSKLGIVKNITPDFRFTDEVKMARDLNRLKLHATNIH